MFIKNGRSDAYLVFDTMFGVVKKVEERRNEENEAV
jgi:hypothetical protein